MGLFKKFNFGLKKTREQMSGAIDSVLEASAAIDDDLFEELEEILIMGDVGVTTAQHIIDRAARPREKTRFEKTGQAAPGDPGGCGRHALRQGGDGA